MKVIAKSQERMGWVCVLCGEFISKAYGRAVLINDEGQETGWLCEQCIEAGPEGAANRTRDRAQRVRDRAREYDRLASDVADITEWVTLAEVTAIDAEIEEGMLEAYHELIDREHDAEASDG